MKSWKEVPHLFANGKFRRTSGTKEIQQLIIGYENFNKTYFTPNDRYYIAGCTLVARPISDMSDEEWNELGLPKSWMKDFTLKRRLKWFSEQRLSGDALIYLLRIGVYPFDQDSPKDVIWRYENE